ncbi:MAG: tryptophanase [Actinomycetaceae bacterium]|nr:tryptophanase [Actinomycetaceae bacterium]
MANVKFYTGEQIPLEMHKVRIIQRLNLPNVDERLEAITQAGNNTFLLSTEHVFLDMLTDSGVNAMSDRQQAAMFLADDAYAGSQTFFRLSKKIKEIFGTEHFLPAHQGRACENLISRTFVKQGDIVPMNYHFTTTKAHITEMGGDVVELLCPEGLEVTSDDPFKGNMDIPALQSFMEEKGDKVPFIRMEAGTNLIGGQPFSLENLEQVRDICRQYGVPLVLDASLLADNLYFIKVREEQCKYLSIREITRRIADACDLIYFSARKLGCARGGGICTNNEEYYRLMRPLVPLFEGFLTYGGMSVREMEALTVGLEETMDEEMINQGPLYIEHMVDKLVEAGIPVITPGGGLGCHVDALKFCDHLTQEEYPAGALAVAMYLASGCRGMERGTMSEQRRPDGSEVLSNMELLRLALPRRVFTLSQVKYAVDRLTWLYENRQLIGGLRFTEEPEVLRFFYGRLEPTSDWQQALVAKFKADFGDSL